MMGWCAPAIASCKNQSCSFELTHLKKKKKKKKTFWLFEDFLVWYFMPTGVSWS